MTKRATVMLCIAAGLLGACSGGGERPGKVQGAVAPRLVVRWLNAHAFGAVPAHLREKGSAFCAQLDHDSDHFVATGYHEKAEDIAGIVFADGG